MASSVVLSPGKPEDEAGSTMSHDGDACSSAVLQYPMKYELSRDLDIAYGVDQWRIREEASLSSIEIGYIVPSSEFTVLGVSSDNAWVHVQTATGSGWACKDYLGVDEHGNSIRIEALRPVTELRCSDEDSNASRRNSSGQESTGEEHSRGGKRRRSTEEDVKDLLIDLAEQRRKLDALRAESGSKLDMTTTALRIDEIHHDLSLLGVDESEVLAVEGADDLEHLRGQSELLQDMQVLPRCCCMMKMMNVSSQRADSFGHAQFINRRQESCWLSSLFQVPRTTMGVCQGEPVHTYVAREYVSGAHC